MKKNIKGGIIAAGLGERFQSKGISIPKAMIEISGKPLIGYTVDHFILAGIADITVIFNSRGCGPCSDYLKQNYSSIDFEIICKDTESSFESFCEVVKRAGESSIVVSTVDSIFQNKMMNQFLRFAENIPDGSIVLGMTDYVDDEKPLYIEVDDNSRVVMLGSEKSGNVTCGLYYLNPGVMEQVKNKRYSSLRYFLKGLIESGVPAFGFPMDKTFDIDTPEDVIKAQEWLNFYSK